MAFTRVTNGNITDADDLNQIIRAWEGDADGGSHPLLLTQVNDAVNYATDVRQLDSTVGLLARWRNYNDENVMRLTKDNILLDKDVVLASGKYIDSLRPQLHNHTGEAGMGPVLTHASIQNRTRKLFIPATNVVDSSYAVRSVPVTEEGWLLPAGKDSSSFVFFQVPEDYASGGDLSAVVRAVENGNAVFGWQTTFGHYLEQDTAGAYEPSLITTMTMGQSSLSTTEAFPAMRAGDIVKSIFQRVGSSASDTLSTEVYLIGFQFSYTADM